MPGDVAPGPSGRPLSSEPRVVIERPPPGLERGKQSAPAWAVALLGALALLLVLGFYGRKLVRRRTP